MKKFFKFCAIMSSIILAGYAVYKFIEKFDLNVLKKLEFKANDEESIFVEEDDDEQSLVSGRTYTTIN